MVEAIKSLVLVLIVLDIFMSLETYGFWEGPQPISPFVDDGGDC